MSIEEIEGETSELPEERIMYVGIYQLRNDITVYSTLPNTDKQWVINILNSGVVLKNSYWRKIVKFKAPYGK
jgi:hypothetical protein